MQPCEPNSCPVAGKVDRLEGEFDEYQAKSGAAHREIYGRLNALEKSSAVIDVQYKSIIDKLDRLTTKVDELEKKPGKSWETVMAALISAVVAGVAAYLLSGGAIG